MLTRSRNETGSHNDEASLVAHQAASERGIVASLALDIAGNPDGFAIFTDFDGTLVDIVGRPEDVVVPRGLRTDIRRVRTLLGGAFAIVTGRTLTEVGRFLGKGLDASGLHGIEFTFAPPAGQSPRAGDAPRELVEGIVRIVAADPGLRLENKGAIIAVHYRQAPAAHGRLRSGLLDLIAALRLDHQIKEGRAVIEVMPRGQSKGTALLEFMQRTPFAGRRPIMIGDDRADEDAFAVAREAGGFGLRVAGEHFNRGDEPFAHAREVRAWLATLAGRMS
ncbi:MAG: trehalose-phosphatase [Phreatobacter sp.]|uniref:trehalose-phosphatase n=1 Tax=Phreatobacter sp. TaxID=1966341 RepID=UPI001A54E4B2|nr:trehalose-phosphatase [Phreatobacter sp.]MBL8569413.1 trehalose-phosphatase [Phreatobacter sp.]